MPAGLMIAAPGEQSIELIIPPLARLFVPVVVKLKGEMIPRATGISMVGFPLMEIVPCGKARMAGCFEAGAERGQTGGDVGFGKAEEGCLCGDVGRFEIVGDLVERLPNSGIRSSHLLRRHMDFFLSGSRQTGTFLLARDGVRSPRHPPQKGREGKGGGCAGETD